MSLKIWEKRVFAATISMKNLKRRTEGLGHEERGRLLFQGDNGASDDRLGAEQPQESP